MTHFLYVTHIIMAAKFIHYGGQITYTTYVYILKIFYGVNNVIKRNKIKIESHGDVNL